MPIWKIPASIQDLQDRSKNTMSDFLGMEFVEIGEDYLLAKMPVTERTKQPMGLLHGGATAAMAETIGSVSAVLCVDPREQSIVGLELQINHIRSVREGYVYARSKPIHIGKSTQVWGVEITTEDGKIVSSAHLTIMVIDTASKS